jgi:hypothetical protein
LKLFVKTTGAFILMDPAGEQVIMPGRVHVARSGYFVQNQLTLGHLTVFRHELPDEASDAEFQAWLVESNGDEELAMDSYASRFAPAAPPPPEPKPRGRSAAREG